jgi:hypothetical protein
MYVYPQFEGRSREHRDLAATIQRVLNLSVEEKNLTSATLSIWTGYEEGLA